MRPRSLFPSCALSTPSRTLSSTLRGRVPGAEPQPELAAVVVDRMKGIGHSLDEPHPLGFGESIAAADGLVGFFMPCGEKRRSGASTRLGFIVMVWLCSVGSDIAFLRRQVGYIVFGSDLFRKVNRRNRDSVGGSLPGRAR